MQAAIQVEQIWQRARKIPLQWIIHSTFALCTTLALFQAADLTWAFSPNQPILLNNTIEQNSLESQRLDLEGIEELYLFGEPEVATDIPTQVSVSSLNLKVTGICSVPIIRIPWLSSAITTKASAATVFMNASKRPMPRSSVFSAIMSLLSIMASKKF